ncbi:MAG: GNAT family N-acetyltransferase [Anaerolineae bacterium]|nr:GNAT family N-acetyltransferase [Anaerolineae bacterium]
MGDIQIRALRTLSEMQEAVALQKTYWGDDLESVIPAHMLLSLANYGGHVLAAMDGGQMVGVLVGFLGTSNDEPNRPAMANLQLVSKRMVVLPEFRGRGIGYHLKREQRRIAIKQGVRLITWTFDPLLAINAQLNIRKLGAISDSYLEDVYGTSEEGGLATLGSSDRLVADWWVTHRRVEERLNGNRTDLGLKHYFEAHTPIVNVTQVNSTGNSVPPDVILDPTGSLVLAEIPINYMAVVRDDPSLARIWRIHTRDLFKRLFGMQYVVTDFIREIYEGRDRAFYLFSQSNRPFEQVDFSQN